MRQLRLTAIFCGPSFFSAVSVLVLSIILLVGANLSYLLKSGLFYDALFGKGTPYDLIQSSDDILTSLNQTILGNPLLNKILFFGFWMMVGLLVYVSIMSLSQVIGEVREDAQSLHYIHARKKLIEEHALVRFALRGVGVIGFVLLSWVMLSFLFPFCVLAVRVGLGQVSQISGWLYCLLGFSVLTLCLHGFVIIARLLWLKPRVLGEWDSVGLSKHE